MGEQLEYALKHEGVNSYVHAHSTAEVVDVTGFLDEPVDKLGVRAGGKKEKTAPREAVYVSENQWWVVEELNF